LNQNEIWAAMYRIMIRKGEFYFLSNFLSIGNLSVELCLRISSLKSKKKCTCTKNTLSPPPYLYCTPLGNLGMERCCLVLVRVITWIHTEASQTSSFSLMNNSVGKQGGETAFRSPFPHLSFSQCTRSFPQPWIPSSFHFTCALTHFPFSNCVPSSFPFPMVHSLLSAILNI